MLAAVRFWLDYPAVNCRQCGENEQGDGIVPECDACPVRDWDRATNTVLALYSMACPGAEIDRGWLDGAFADLDIPGHERPLYRRLVLAVHRQVTEHHVHRSQSPSSD